MEFSTYMMGALQDALYSFFERSRTAPTLTLTLIILVPTHAQTLNFWPTHGPKVPRARVRYAFSRFFAQKKTRANAGDSQPIRGRVLQVGIPHT